MKATTHTLAIKPLPKKEDEINKYFDPGDPIIPVFSLLIFGNVRAGKTTLLNNILMNEAFKIKDWFFNENNLANVFVFSPTFEIDENWRFVNKLFQENELHDQVYEDINEKAIAKIIRNQTKLMKQNNGFKQKQKSHILFIIDDNAGSNQMSNRSSILSQLAMKHRHLNISLIILSQSYKLVANSLRRNAKYIAIFGLRNNDEIESFINENRSTIAKKKFEKMFEEILNGPAHSFMFIDRTKPLKDSFSYCFERPFTPGILPHTPDK